jgi:FkbM family methyltransferase
MLVGSSWFTIFISVYVTWNTFNIYPHKKICLILIIMRVRSYSQLKQDLKVVEWYHGKKNGYFVDVGAHDGITLSNTYLLEKYYQWTGVCVEPLPDKYVCLHNIRSHSHCVNQAVFSTGGLTMPLSRNGLFSGLTECLDTPHSVGKPTIPVLTVTLTEVLRESRAPDQIDYLSLDTEGSELEVLKSVDLDQYHFGLIHVEHNYIEPKRSQIKQLLETHGYHYETENQWDDIYRGDKVPP